MSRTPAEHHITTIDLAEVRREVNEPGRCPDCLSTPLIDVYYDVEDGGPNWRVVTSHDASCPNVNGVCS